MSQWSARAHVKFKRAPPLMMMMMMIATIMIIGRADYGDYELEVTRTRKRSSSRSVTRSVWLSPVCR